MARGLGKGHENLRLDHPLPTELAPFGGIIARRDRVTVGGRALPAAAFERDWLDRRHLDPFGQTRVDRAVGGGELPLPCKELSLAAGNDRTVTARIQKGVLSQNGAIALMSGSPSARLKAARRMRMAVSGVSTSIPFGTGGCSSLPG